MHKLNQGDIVDVTVEAAGKKGDGIAKLNGFVLFIPNVNVGEHLKVKVTKVMEKFGFAETIEKLPEAPARNQGRQQSPIREPEKKVEYEHLFRRVCSFCACYPWCCDVSYSA